MSWTSPNTVAITTVPFVYPAILSRYFSSCATARFITSADCNTNGRISSPAPNLSPTSFIAGSSTLLRTATGSGPLSATVALCLDPVLAAAQDLVVDAHLDRRVGVLVDRRGGGAARDRRLRLEVFDQPLQC